MPKIIYTDSYNKKAGKFIKKHPELKKQYKKVLEILEVNPYHASLRLHKLEGKLKDLYSISINMRYRISLEFIIEDEKIIPINVGSHDEIY
ncbi:MAG: type II toxin-antitoxin system RelE/ParE family toxin [Spirochaetes bacterium]|nr:type II toxin-antitoxin system RelE/ParE family toxin [Spirochaetota bacterium]